MPCSHGQGPAPLFAGHPAEELRLRGYAAHLGPGSQQMDAHLAAQSSPTILTALCWFSEVAISAPSPRRQAPSLLPEWDSRL